LLFTLVPPTAYFGGWFCFFMSLVWLAGVTAVIADMAEIFGCVVGIGDMVTAITFVACGTSMPDLFASLSAATEDPSADASVVNVTGSNSVNVFLGLGLPWTIASIYWAARGEDAEWAERYFPGVPAPSPFLKVPASSLGFSVGLFSIMCLAALALLMLRRRVLGCELGGPVRAKWTSGSVMVIFWLLYIGVASWYSMRSLGDIDPQELILVLVVAALIFIATMAMAVIVILTSKEEAAIDKPKDAVEKLALADDACIQLPSGMNHEECSEEPESAPEVGDIRLGVKKCTGGDISKEWSTFLSQVPPHHMKVAERVLASVQEDMQAANYACDDAAMDASMLKGVEVFRPIFASTLDVSADSVREVFSALDLAPASSATRWLQVLGTLAAAIGHERRLAKVLVAEADKVSAGNRMYKIVIATRMAKFGVSTSVVDRVRAYDSSLRGMPVTFMDTEGDDTMRMFEQVARLLGIDFQRGVLRPIIQARLAAWGLCQGSADEVLIQVSDERRASQARAEICRAFLCDRPTAWDVAQFAVRLHLDTSQVFYKPILAKHLSCLGFNEEVVRGFSDSMQDPEEVTRLQRLLDQAIQRPFWAPPDKWAAAGFDVVGAVGKIAVEAALVRAGFLEDDAIRIAAQVGATGMAEVREPVMSLLSGVPGLSLRLEELGEIFDINPREVLLKPLIRGRLSLCGVPLERAILVSDSVLGMSVLTQMEDQLVRMVTPEKLTVEDIVNFGKALGINFVTNLLAPLITEKLKSWGVPASDASDFAKLCSKAGMLGSATVADLMTTLFVHEKGGLEELVQLATEASAPPDKVLRAIKKAALARLLVPETIAESMSTKPLFGLEDEIEAIAKVLMCKGDIALDVDELIELAKGTGVGATDDVIRPMFRSWLFLRGVREDALQLASSKISSPIVQRDARCKRAFSEAVLGNRATVESVRVLCDNLGIKHALLLGPMLRKQLVEWHVPAAEANKIAERAASTNMREPFDVLLFGQAPSAAKLSELCDTIGVPPPFTDMLTAWLTSHGVPKDDAVRTVSNAMLVEEQMLFATTSDDFKKPDTATAAILVRSALPDFLREWGFSEDEALALGNRYSEVRGQRLVELIAESLVLRCRGRVEDLEQLAILARMDATTSLLHPIVRHRVLPLCVSMADANKVADEACSKGRLPVMKGLIARVALRGQPSVVDVTHLLQSCGVSTAGIDMAMQASHAFSEPESPHPGQELPSTAEPEPEMTSPCNMVETHTADFAQDPKEVEVCPEGSPIKRSTTAKKKRKSTLKSGGGPPKAGPPPQVDVAVHSSTLPSRRSTPPDRSTQLAPFSSVGSTIHSQDAARGDTSKKPSMKAKKKSVRKTPDRADVPALEPDA